MLANRLTSAYSATSRDVLRGIKNIIFDFGGVLIDLDKERCVESFAKLGINVGGNLGQYVQGGIFSRIETGKATNREFCDAVRAINGRKDLDDQQIFDAWNDFLVGIPEERLNYIAGLKQKYRLSLLSNTNAIHWDYSTYKFFTVCGHTVDYYFDNIFLSFKMGMAKPDAEIFRQAVTEAGIAAHETLFIDDSIDNCVAAQNCGLQTFHSQSGGDWIKLFENDV